MTSLMPPRIAFQAKIASATQSSSPGGAKIIKPEYEEAIAQLGQISDADRALVRDTLEGKQLSQSVARAYRKLVKGVPGTDGKISSATQEKVRDQFNAVRGANELGESYTSLPVGSRFETFTLEDSTCKPNMICIWAGELWTAHLPAGGTHAPKDPNKAENFFVGRSSPGQAPQYYGPFSVDAPKVTHHAPKVESARFDGGNGLQFHPTPARGPAIVLKASFYPIDVKPSFKVDVQGSNVTVTCDATRKKGAPVPRGIMMPKDFEVPFFPPEPGASYTLHVVDREGNKLTPSKTISTAMPV